MAVAALGFISIGQTIALLIGGIDLSVGPLSGSWWWSVRSTSLRAAVAEPSSLGWPSWRAPPSASGSSTGPWCDWLSSRPSRPLSSPTSPSAVLGTSASSARRVDQWPSQRLHPDTAGTVPGRLPRSGGGDGGIGVGAAPEPLGKGAASGGSYEDAARRLGVHTNRVAISAYVAASLSVFFGAIVLMAQIGIGDAAQGIGYTLSSVTAVVLGGTSLLGGRGTFVGTLLGSVLIVQVLNATVSWASHRRGGTSSRAR